ncbi:MAG: T9SS type A sorting domain-containing protein [Flavobacteriaceae bacterium]|nr:T9SS type A sorting domain-containing protein [Flavobacteriaceae bacterium]MDG2314061.1 T9SS type A sorting domain-containing protein [Flavobacteriaceae bacterium]
MKHFYTFFLALVLTVSFSHAQNLITNSTFTDATNWALANTSGSIKSPADSHTADGSSSFELIAQNGNYNGQIKHDQIGASKLEAGSYMMSYWVKGPVGSRSKLQVYQGAAINSAVHVSATADWEQVTHSFMLTKTGAGPRVYNSKNDGTSVILIDDVVFKRVTTEAPASLDFATGWYPVNATATISGSTHTLNLDAGTPKLKLYDHHVDADTNKFIKIVLKNNSINTGLQISYLGSDGNIKYNTQTITASDTAEKTYEFEMINAWDGNIEDINIVVKKRKADDSGWTTVDASSGETVDFSAITISAASTLTLQDFGETSISIYPNPVSNQLSIVSDMKIESVEVLDLMGRTVLSSSQKVAPMVNVSSLQSGVYMIKLSNKQGESQTKKFIKK